MIFLKKFSTGEKCEKFFGSNFCLRSQNRSVGTGRFSKMWYPTCRNVGPSPYVLPFLEGLTTLSRTRLSNNRSVMPLDVLGRTRATLKGSACPSLSERSG